jgi:ribonuclease HI
MNIYTDGSFWQGKYAYAFLVTDMDNMEIYRESGLCPVEFHASANIGAEICAVVNGIRWSLRKGYMSLTIHHDYNGIGHWANDQWDAKVPITVRYRDFVNAAAAKGMFLYFHWVKGHGTDPWNIAVDKMASSVFDYSKIDKDLELPKGTKSKPVNNNVPLDILQASKEFMEFIDVYGIRCDAHSINSQCAKFKVYQNRGQGMRYAGYGNVYASGKGPIFRAHEIQDKDLQVDLVRYWGFYVREKSMVTIELTVGA